MDEQPKGNILSGYRVLDLADEQGMFCARLLADMGAEVIRVEPPGTGPAAGPEIGYLNAGKRRITLDLEKEAGRGLFRRLAGTVDVVLETAAPGYMASLGLGYKELSGKNPRLVMASVTGFGQDGPYRDGKSSDLTLAALGGWLSVTGEPQAPLKPYGRQSYYAASLFAANGILLALWHRHATGKGQYIDISIMECVAATLDHVLVRYRYEGVISRRRGSRHWNDAFRLFKCQDGYVLLSLFQHWDTLVAWLESEGMAGDLTDEKWRGREARLRGAGHIAGVLERWAACHNVDELVEKGQLMRFPWAGVASVNDLLDNPQLAAREYFADMEIPGGESYKMPGAPVKMGRATWRVGSRVAALGEDNAEIYHRELGLDAAEAEALAGEGVI